MKKVYIELTDDQKKKLFPLFDDVMEHAYLDPVMLLAQIHITGADAVAVCTTVPNDKSLKIQALYGEKFVGKMAGDKCAKANLKKARAEK